MLMAQLLKSQQKGSSVLASGAANQDKSNRTRTKSNATTTSMVGLANKDQKHIGSKQSLQKASGAGGSQFIGSGQPINE